MQVPVKWLDTPPETKSNNENAESVLGGWMQLGWEYYIYKTPIELKQNLFVVLYMSIEHYLACQN